MTDNEIKSLCIDYLLMCGFVDAYCKKLMFASDVNNLYEDYRNECWLAILKLEPGKFADLYRNSVTARDKDPFFQLRNYISILIRNTVRSTSSDAYKLLKKHNTRELYRNGEQWHIMSNTLADPGAITEQIKNRDD